MSDAVAPMYGEVMTFRDTLDAETDRGCALMAAAYLDDQVERLLRHSLLSDGKSLDDLFGRSGPLSSFSSRIDLCFAMGLLPKLACRDLRLIRRIRNQFAHLATPLSFDDPAILDRCRELHHVTRPDALTGRQHFTNGALGVCGVIHAHLGQASTPRVPTDILVDPADRRLAAAQVLDDLRAAEPLDD